MVAWHPLKRPEPGRGLAFTNDFRTLSGMKDVAFTYWQDGEHWLGHLDEFPDYLTQGSSLEDLREHLADLHAELTSGAIPHVRRHAKLQLA